MGGNEIVPTLPNRTQEPLVQVIAGISHSSPIDLNGDGTSSDREIQIFGLNHPQLLSREAVIYLPEAYFTDDMRRFPVLYAHDAQNLFSPFAPFGEWRLDEVLNALTDLGLVEPHIVVGINHTENRIFDYTSTSIEIDGETMGGGADAYAELIVNQLKPYVDLHFRTQPERESTTLLGSSLGGLVSLYIYTQAFTTFGKVGAVSASLWWPRDSNSDWTWLTNSVGQDLPVPERVWIDIGGAEASRTFLQRGTSGNYTRYPYEDLVGELRLRGMDWGPNGSLGYLEDPYADHHEPAWARRLPHILRYLLSTDRPETLSDLYLSADRLHFTDSACETANLRLEARYGDGLRLTVPNDLVTFTSFTSWIQVDSNGQVTISEDLFEPGGLLESNNSTVLQGQIEAGFGGLATRLLISVGGDSSPHAQVLVYAPSRPASIAPSSDLLYVASGLSEPAWVPNGFPLQSLDVLSSPELLTAVGGRDRWVARVPVNPVAGESNEENIETADENSCVATCSATQLALKVTRGTWETVEGAAVNVDRPNHEINLTDCQQSAEVFVDAWLDGQ